MALFRGDVLHAKHMSLEKNWKKVNILNAYRGQSQIISSKHIYLLAHRSMFLCSKSHFKGLSMKPY